MANKHPTYNVVSNADTLHAVYSEHNSWLTGWLAKAIGCPQNAADLAHDTFVRVMTRGDASTVTDHRPWLLTIAKRLLIDKSRRQKLERAYLEALHLASESPETSPSSEELWMAVQTLELIAKALEKLAEKPRQAFLLRHIDGLTQAAIAERLGVSVTMVRNYLVQALVACHSVVENISMANGSKT